VASSTILESQRNCKRGRGFVLKKTSAAGKKKKRLVTWIYYEGARGNDVEIGRCVDQLAGLELPEK